MAKDSYIAQTDDQALTHPDRFLGGKGDNPTVNVHPYVKGYFYTFYEFPTALMSKYFNDSSNGKLGGILLSLNEGFTPPGDRQLKTEDVMGVGGIDASFVTGQTIDRNFSLMYRDIWGSPIFKIHRAWTSVIDPYLGGNLTSEDFLPQYYKGKILVVQTKPFALGPTQKASRNVESWKKKIIKVHYFDGVVPTTDLNSVYDANITDNSIVRPSIQYRFDGKEYDETVDGMIDYAAKKMKGLAARSFPQIKTIKYKEL